MAGKDKSDPAQSPKHKAKMGFEANPPRCVNCVHCASYKISYVEAASRCRLGKFRTNKWSICDKWLGKDGSTLE